MTLVTTTKIGTTAVATGLMQCRIPSAMKARAKEKTGEKDTPEKKAQWRTLGAENKRGPSDSRGDPESGEPKT